jgi:hypothetical protein
MSTCDENAAEETGFPAAPWRLRGRVAIAPLAVRAAAARRALDLPPRARLLTAGPWTAGALVLARYDASSTLAYHELVVLAGLVLAGGTPGFAVSHIYVDSEASRRGGRSIWGLPKELARFAAAGGSLRVEAADGRALATVRVGRRPRGARVPLAAPVLGTLGERPRRATGRGALRAAPGTLDVELPPGSPLHPLGVAGRHPALVGAELDVRFPPPRAAHAGWAAAARIDPQVCARGHAG